MEMIKEEKKYWETVIRGSEKVNSDGDIIVPDVKPDVLKVLQIDARSVITDKGITAGGLYAQGKIYVNILYVTDGEDETGCIKTVLDFRTKIDNPSITNDMKLRIESDVIKIDFILLNSRKLSVKATVGMEYEIIAEKSIEYSTGFDGDCAEVVKESVLLDTIGVEEEYGFTVRGAVEIPAGKPSVKELIKTDVKVLEREVKIVASKVIINGTLGVCALYFAEDMTIDYCEGEMVFTEVFGVDDLYEDDICSMDLTVGEIETELSEDNDGDIRIINVESFVAMNVRAGRTEEVNYICDCYCPGSKTDIEHQETNVMRYVDCIIKQTNEKNVIQCDTNIPEISKIYNVVAEPEVTKCTVTKGGVTVCGKVKFYILYITKNPKCAVYSLKKEEAFEYYYNSEEVKEGMECDVKSLIEHLSYNLNSKGEIEIKYTLTNEIRVTERVALKCVSEARISQQDEENDIVIYFLKEGDSLWGIGKKYGVRVSDIMEINGLENDKVCEGQKLLIPVS